MIKQQVRYEDFDGIQQEETLYFNLNRMELIALQARYGKDDMAKYIEKVQAEEDYQKMYDLLNDIVLTSYGVRRKMENASSRMTKFVKISKLHLLMKL